MPQELLSPNSTLYCTYTHLVCRDALPGPKVQEKTKITNISNMVAKVREKSDLSHEVHADNCTVTGALCDPSPPAYSYRSVSALLYLRQVEIGVGPHSLRVKSSALLYLSSLHNHFEGGRFFFADRHPGGRAFTPTTFVEPRCGRLLAFTSGPENLHGVMPVAAGTRFVVVLKFSFFHFLFFH